MQRYVWYSDVHLNLSVLPFLKHRFISRLKGAEANGMFITGDVSTGLLLESDLKFIARNFDGPVYFVLGNHDYHLRHIDSVHADVRRICEKHPNLHWMTNEGVISLKPDIALIGTEGWYDATEGNVKWLKFMMDSFMTFDFLMLDGFSDRLNLWREMAAESASFIEKRLEEALRGHRMVYVLTHVPPWHEAAQRPGTLFERFFLPYNTNEAMGKAIEGVMERHPDKRVVVLAGHTHNPVSINMSPTIECKVARASYWGRVGVEETIVF